MPDRSFVGMGYVIEKLLSEADPAVCAEHSFFDYHVQGLHYLNLVRTPQLTVKLYVFDHIKHNSRDYIVWPHNHRYSFGHYGLLGEVINHHLVETPGARWQKYSYHADDNGRLEKTIKCDLFCARQERVAPGEFYSLDPSQIHTLHVENEYAAAVLWQHTDAPNLLQTNMYAPVNEIADCSNADLYRVPCPDEYRETLKTIRGQL